MKKQLEKLIKKEYRVSVITDIEELKTIFFEYGFNIEKDVKKQLNKQDVRKMFEELASAVENGRIDVLVENSYLKGSCFIKTRHQDPKNNRGKSSGIRFISLVMVNEKDNLVYVLPAHFYSKTGPKRKDNISDYEENQLKNFLEDLLI